MDELPEVYNRPFDWTFVLRMVESRLGMFVGRPTYERAVALIIGFDLAQPESINGPMKQLINDRYDSGSLDWSSVLMTQAIGGDLRDPSSLTPEQDALAIAQLVADLRLVLGIESGT